MVDVLVRRIPKRVHAALRRRAEQRGLSLQRYLAAELSRIAARPDMGEVLDRIAETREGGKVGFQQAVEDLRQVRHRR